MVGIPRVIQRITVAAALGGAAVMAAGCGSGAQGQASGGSASTAPAGGAASSPGRTRTPAVGAASASAGSTVSAGGAGLSACPAPALRISLGSPGGPGAGQAAGNSYETIDFINDSRRSCDLYGYPGVSFAGSTGATIGNPARRSGNSAVHVTVAPGGTAHAWLNVANAMNYPAQKCHMVTAHRLRVFPPNQTAAIYVTLSGGEPACSSTAETIMVVYPVRAGTGMQGQFP
jgi:Protein of unknown function (DUF4232)